MTTWASGDDIETARPLLDKLRLSRTLNGADLVIGLTAGTCPGKVDGLSRTGSPYILVRHHPGEPDRDAYVITHEIGHVLGLDHHTCRDQYCFMARMGYDPREHWCPDHLELLAANAGYFRLQQSHLPS